ncbi:MAG TPA: hypothetical protein VMR34_00265 [Candidatus Saccharimonadales bacterium]|nr:hypothetical protein [Candidatus Saccharimonadales bacterium]
MKKLNNNDSGFSAVELILAIVILALIGTVGWLVYKNHHKTTSASAATVSTAKPVYSSTKTTTVTNPYTGWKSFCSSYGGLCLKYPSNWSLATKSVGVDPDGTIAPEPTTTEANITSPSGNVTVEYQPYCTQLAAPPAGTYTDNVLSVTSPTSTPGFKIVKAVSSYQGSSSSNISENLYLTSNAVVQQNGITVGSHTNTTGNDDESAAGFFENTKSTISTSNLQCLNVGSLNNSAGGNYLNFSSIAEAQAWFSNSEVQTANQILSSVSYN